SGEGFSRTCIVIDKMDKLPEDVIEDQLSDLGLDSEAISTIQSVLSITDLTDMESALGQSSQAVSELMALFSLAESYGFDDWIELDASVVRGLAYYTGSVFEAHDREGELRALCGGGRYDKLISTLGGKDLPATGFGFGDMVVMELLQAKGLVPEIPNGVQDIVFGMGSELRQAAMKVASSIRSGGRSVDLVLEDKRMKWVFRHADRVGAERLLMVMPDEWSKGTVKIKNLATGEESEVLFESL
ncbi:MAG: ATP phosphoribosyltransferase regulatory subunit, partial [Candidatus Thalassarchaeaceae archaeon]|nr:ATP phosphoribosyltransferase regulatory subunit [Candidatus Thalassarchaeaceae archaeon]